MAINLIVTIIERVPSLVKKDKEKLRGVILLLFHEMVILKKWKVGIDKEIDEEWMQPKEGFKDELENGEVDNDEVHFGM